MLQTKSIMAVFIMTMALVFQSCAGKPSSGSSSTSNNSSGSSTTSPTNTTSATNTTSTNESNATPTVEESVKYPGVEKIVNETLDWSEFDPDSTFSFDGEMISNNLTIKTSKLAGSGILGGKESVIVWAKDISEFTGTIICEATDIEVCNIYTETPADKFQMTLNGNFIIHGENF